MENKNILSQEQEEMIKLHENASEEYLNITKPISEFNHRIIANFLDLKIRYKNGEIQPDLFEKIKEIAKKQLTIFINSDL